MLDVNIPEATLEQFTEKEINDFITLNNIENIKMFSSRINIKQNIKNIEKDKEFWRLLVMLSLLFITIEILLIKTLKT